VYDIFCNVKELETFQKQFLADLQENENELGTVFLRWVTKLFYFI